MHRFTKYSTKRKINRKYAICNAHLVRRPGRRVRVTAWRKSSGRGLRPAPASLAAANDVPAARAGRRAVSSLDASRYACSRPRPARPSSVGSRGPSKRSRGRGGSSRCSAGATICDGAACRVVACAFCSGSRRLRRCTCTSTHTHTHTRARANASARKPVVRGDFIVFIREAAAASQRLKIKHPTTTCGRRVPAFGRHVRRDPSKWSRSPHHCRAASCLAAVQACPIYIYTHTHTHTHAFAPGAVYSCSVFSDFQMPFVKFLGRMTLRDTYAPGRHREFGSLQR